MKYVKYGETKQSSFYAKRNFWQILADVNRSFHRSKAPKYTTHNYIENTNKHKCSYFRITGLEEYFHDVCQVLSLSLGVNRPLQNKVRPFLESLKLMNY